MRLSPTLSFYIVRQFLAALLSVLLIIMGIILLFDVIELIRRAAGRPDLGLGPLLGMGVLKLPQMLHTVLPFGMMIAAMIAFWRLTRTHELVVARAAGISVWQILTPVLMAVTALGVLEVTAFNPLAAAMYSRFERMQSELLQNRGNTLDVSEVGLWLREGDETGQMVVHAEDVRQQGLVLDLGDVHIFKLSSGDAFTQRLWANRGRLLNGRFELSDVWVMEVGKPSVHQDRVDLPTELSLERVHDNFASPETMSFWQLPGFISFFERAGFAATKHRMYLQSLLASPLLYCAMALLAAVFTLRPNNRGGGAMLRIGGGVACGFVVYFFSKIVYAFGLSATLPQSLAAWSPAIVAGLFGLAGLFHLEDG